MIGKLNPQLPAHFGNTLPSSPSKAHENAPFPFESLLTERLFDPKPLDLMMIEFLSRTIEMFFSRDTGEEDNFFIAPSFSFNLPGAPSQKTLSKPIEGPHPLTPPFHNGLHKPKEPQENERTPQPNGQPVEASNDLHIAEGQEYRNPGGDDGIDGIINEASRRYGVESALISAVMTVESGGNPNALSPAGAQGLMQLMPGTAADLGVINPFDPAQNIMAGTRYLRLLLDRYRGNTRLALAAYNWGMGNLEKRPDAMPRETTNYITKVEALYRTRLSASL